MKFCTVASHPYSANIVLNFCFSKKHILRSDLLIFFSISVFLNKKGGLLFAPRGSILPLNSEYFASKFALENN